MKKLNDVTLVCITSIKLNESWMSVRHCMNQMEFGEVKFITHDSSIVSKDGISVEKCRYLTSSEAYSYFVIFDLHRYINTKYCLIVQHDGFILTHEYIPCVSTTHGDFYRHHGNGYFAEDYNICVHNAHIYERFGCVFAPYEVACKFSRECTVDAQLQRNTFGIHGPMTIWIPEYKL